MTADPAGELVMRVAGPDDAPTITQILAEAFEGYRAWAPPEWSPPLRVGEEAPRLAAALSRPGVWCLMAVAEGRAAGHVALAPFTMVQPLPPPTGTVNLWQLFVRPPWQGRGVAAELMRAAVAEGQRRGFERMRLWTPQGAARAHRFYEREGWTRTGRPRDDTPLGLPVVQYARGLVGGA